MQGGAKARDTIQFSLGQGATIVLKKRLPAITDTSGLTILGGTTANIIVSGNGKVGVFVERKGAQLDLRNLTVADGFANGKNPGGDIGGGIKNNGGTLKVIRSTFSGNNALAIGGGIANINGGNVTVKNSTFSGNRAGSAGGGIQNANQRGVTLSLSSTVLANSAQGNINNVCAAGTCRGKIVDGGYNISDDASYRFPANTSKIRTNPRLDPGGLEDNGGPTGTIALQTSSPAINFVPKSTNGCGTSTSIDQRDVHRPQGKRCDAGAFERKLRR